MLEGLSRLYATLTSEDEEGQGLAEYALIISLVVLVVFSALALLGPRVATFFNSAANSIPEM